MPKAAPHPDTEISQKKYGETTIGELRKTYGADFAEGCADNEKIVDVLRKLPSLRSVIRDHEAKRFEQILKAYQDSGAERSQFVVARMRKA